MIDTMIRPNILAVILLYTVAVVLLACITYPGIAHAKPQTVRAPLPEQPSSEPTDERRAWLDGIDAPVPTVAVATHVTVKATTTVDASSILEKPQGITVTASVARRPMSQAQIDAIVGLLQAFGVDYATRQNVRYILTNTR
jgi:hypothetical protein